ncbi:transposase, MuDR, MULE transposase domain protein [Tanacetum coccineum]
MQFKTSSNVTIRKAFIAKAKSKREVKGEDVDVVNAEGFDRDTCYDDETNTYMSRSSKEAKDRVYMHSIDSKRKLKLYKNENTRVSVSKPFKVKAKAEREVKGDHTLQYVTLRDYVVELQSTNLNTTIKIVVERNIDHSLPTWVFKRIYVCLGALKLRFRACRRELLGLDDAFMKGPFSSQVLAAVGVDSNNGIYPLAYALVEAEMARTRSCRKWKLTGIPCKHVVAACWNMAQNERGVPPPKAWVNPCYWLSTWRETYSHKMKPINGTNYREKSTCPTTFLPPNHHVQIGRPKKKRKMSKLKDEPFVKDEPPVGLDGLGGSGVGQVPNAYGSGFHVVIGLFVAGGQPGCAGVGIGSRSSSHGRWRKIKLQIERLSPQKRTPTQPASQA